LVALRILSPALVGPVAAVGLILAQPQVTARVATGANPCESVVAAAAVWVANEGDGTLVRIDPRTNRVTATIRLGRGTCAVAAGAGAVWVANERTGSLLRVDPRTRRTRSVVVGGAPFDVLVAAGTVWTTGFGNGTLVGVDPRTMRVTRRIRVGGAPTGLLYNAGAIWVGLGRGATAVLRVDPGSGSIQRFDVGATAPSHFVATTSGIWVANDGDTLVHIDPASGGVSGVVHAGRTLGQAALGADGTLWVPDKEIDRIFRLDATTGQLLESFTGSDGAFQALAAFGSVWVTSYAGTDVWRFRAGH
jgi:YVTN family beta-propeller protein